MRTDIRFWRYVGEPCLTRGDYGVSVSGGHTPADDPGGIYVFDPDCGDMAVCTIEQAAANGFVEITGAEHAAL